MTTGKVRAIAAASLIFFGIADTAKALADSGEESLKHDGTSFVQQADGSYLHVDDKTHQAITEDDPRWSCVDDGNKVCGPGNSNGVPAGCYDDGGVLVAEWPCKAWSPADGYLHPNGTRTFVSVDSDPDEYIYQAGHTN